MLTRQREDRSVGDYGKNGDYTVDSDQEMREVARENFIWHEYCSHV